MVKIKDKYLLGIIISIIANFIRSIFSYLTYQFGITQYLPRQIAAATFITPTRVDSFSGLLIGIVADYGVAIFFGLSIIYLLYFTGTEYLLIKGISIGLLY